MAVHHTDDPVCELCLSKISTAHPYLQGWFKRIKQKYPSVHVSWAFRDQINQEEAFKEGKSKLHFPLSAHNHTEKTRPYSLAIDIFQIDADGMARFSPLFCAKVNADNEEANEPLLWGGKWKKLGDMDHFQIDLTKLKK